MRSSGLFPKQFSLTINYLNVLISLLAEHSAAVLMIIWKVKVVIRRGWITEEHWRGLSSPDDLA